MNTTAKEYQNQCDNCEHCNQIYGACNLQDFNHCVNVCKTWEEVYKNCPLKKMKTFNITWFSRGVYRHIKIEAETKEEARQKFYNMAAETAFIINCEQET